ncbi:alpha/beta hydrolase [Flavobacterium sp. P4023]|uniref:Alpha/beta hydrolase n=1 Tax=Flavobacterium flabelliforme TaxID=2816119 RepID=A0ABS5CQM7_9FLAO|nr:alpha/beta hydrolase [Flavobacterium flabelliforme]MBP4140932.1 alpha/beta hydrolase [Flavobacterium flabelliforme]
MKKTQFKNTQISYTDVGKGTAIVLLHGFLENKTMWDFYVPEFAKKNRVITIDLLGHGESECLGYVHSMEDHADAVYAVLSELRIRKAFFVGHSMGGYVVLAFAELYPEYIKGIALLNSTAKADNEERKINRDRAVKAVKQSFVNFISLSISNLFSENNRERLAVKIDKVKKEALKTPLQGIVASLEGMKIRTDRELILHLSTFPILMVLGEKDPVLPYHETSKQIEQTKVELITYADGHMSYIENQENLLKVLIAFFKKI